MKNGPVKTTFARRQRNIVTGIAQKKQNRAEILKSCSKEVIIEQSVNFRQKKNPSNVLNKSLSDRRDNVNPENGNAPD